MEPPGTLWWLHKALPGIRSASKSWQDKESTASKTIGFTRSMLEPCAYFFEDKLVMKETHGDDSLLIGPRKGVMEVRNEYPKHEAVHFL